MTYGHKLILIHSKVEEKQTDEANSECNKFTKDNKVAQNISRMMSYQGWKKS